VHLEHPLQAPASLVEDVGYFVRSGVAAGIDGVGEAPAAASLAAQLIREQHLRRGVAGRHVVLEQVARVVPAADRVDRGPGPRAVGRPPVVLVAFHAEPRVVSASLLSHELEQLVRQLGQGPLADGERQRPRLAEPHDVAPRPAERREVELGLMLERPPSLARQRRGFPRKDGCPGLGADHGELGRHGRPGERHGDLRVSGVVPDLAGPDKDLVRAQRRPGQEPGEQSGDAHDVGPGCPASVGPRAAASGSRRVSCRTHGFFTSPSNRSSRRTNR
jgi:hypothetical protein